jgi:hypothetical protein
VSSAPTPSYCDYCGGVFAGDPWALGRSERCHSCGAGKHWECQRHTSVFERSTRESGDPYNQPDGKPQKCWYTLGVHPRSEWIVSRESAEIGQEEIAEWLARGEGILDPLDGSFVSAEELLGQRNYGRSRTDSERTREHDDGGDRITSAFPQGGWGPAKGSTGGKRGRKPGGVREQDKLLAELVRLTNHPIVVERLRDTLSRNDDVIFEKDLRDDLAVLVSLMENPNMQALADTLGLGRRRTYRLREKGQQLLTVMEQVRDEVASLRNEMKAEHAELIRIAFAFRFGETPVEAWERLLDQRSDPD